jgi:hypothetical protein
MANLTFDFLNGENGTPVDNDDMRAFILERVEEQQKASDGLVEDWKNYQAGLADMSVMDALAEMGVRLTENKRGWECLAIGDPIKQLSVIPEYTSTGLNIISKVASGRYKRLRPGYHERWFDPSRPHKAVIAAFFDGKWNFFDWKNGALRRPTRRIPQQTWKNMVVFHDEIDQLLDAPKNYCYQVTLNRDDDKALYQSKIHDRLEMTLDEFQVALGEDDEKASEQRKLNSGVVSGDVPVIEEREDLIKELTRLRTKQKVTVKSPFNTEAYLWFDPEDKDKAFATIRSYAPGYEFVGYEPVAE